MMLWLYTIGIDFYGLIIRFVALFNQKANLFVQGRKNIFQSISNKINQKEKHIWFHFASLGEFEQGRPVLEKLKNNHPDKKVIITFFSPSGYEIRKNYALAKGIFYLPLDTKSNAKMFIEAINPEMAIFTKYEYWYHYFSELHHRNIPLYIISGIFRENQVFFKPYGGLYRKILSFVSHFFVQNQESVDLLKTIGFENTSLSGDTRFDRVYENALTAKKLTEIEQFCDEKPTLIAGSTWQEDEKLLSALPEKYSDWKFIIAPHEIDENHIQSIEKLFSNSIRFSVLSSEFVLQKLHSSNLKSNVLIIDNIGMLSSLYQYGKMAYIGGGFGAGIHNTLEAAAFGLPVIFGPKYNKFQEAKDLIKIGAAQSISSMEEMQNAFEYFKENTEATVAAKVYVAHKKGATDLILKEINLTA